MQELADDLAFGIETLRTRAERDHAVHEQLLQAEFLRHSLQDSIKAIADTVEMRDPYTAGHQRRVGKLAIAIAKELDLPEQERQDGSGYPHGLKGEQILLESRILAVADVVEAMASHRPYRPALGIDSALKEIQRGRGSAFDAAVVDACLRLFTDKRFAFSA